jgi:hypothetical protein
MKHENGRVKRGLYICPVTGIKINADLNAARNIAKRIGYNTPIPRKILSYIVTTNGVKPLTPKEGVTVETPTMKKPRLFETGRGSFTRCVFDTNGLRLHHMLKALFSWKFH